ncbi:MAG: NINE protein [Bacteroidota bacterium]
MDKKDKNVAAVLAFFLGTFGVHRFYLGQIWLGIVHCVFMATMIPTIIGFIDAMVFLSMDQDQFDAKYNWRNLKEQRKRERWEKERRKEDKWRENRRKKNLWEERKEEAFERKRYHREREIENWERRQKKRKREESRQEKEKARQQERQERKAEMQRKNTYKAEGIKRFKEYDYEGAIDCFEQVLDVDAKDVAAHFNLACAYSLIENTERSIFHLDQAVKNGFNDFQKIRTHDALAYLRIQDAFEDFADKGFKLEEQAPPLEVTDEPPTEEIIFKAPPQVEAPKTDLLQTTPDLLDQLQKLGDLKERGLLSEEEFTREKKRLLN